MQRTKTLEGNVLGTSSYTVYKWKTLRRCKRILDQLKNLPDCPPSVKEQQADLHHDFQTKLGQLQTRQLSLPHLILTKYPEMDMQQLSQADQWMRQQLDDTGVDTLTLLEQLPQDKLLPEATSSH